MLQQREVSQIYSIFMILIKIIIIITIMMALAQNPISTKSHIWDFVRQYGIMFFIIVIIIITRPKPAYGRQGLAGSWGQDTDEVSTFLVFLTSHFAPAALSSPGTINDNENPTGNLEKPWKPTKNHEKPLNHLEKPWKPTKTHEKP